MRKTFAILLCIAILSLAAAAQAGPGNIKGWEKGGAYDKLYDNTERDTFKGKLVDIVEVTPLPGMAPGLALVVVDRDDGEKVVVHLGPRDFVAPRIKNLRPGGVVKVFGVLAQVAGKNVYLAAKIKKDDTAVKFRLTKDGTPFWSLPEAELAREEAQGE